MDTTEQNRKQELWLSDGKNVVFIPQNWCDEFSPDEQAEEPEIMCYAPSYTYANSPVENLWIPVSKLDKMPRLSQAEARIIHPELFAKLARIDAGGE